MTCGMIYVMRRERRGGLHLGKYSPPKAKFCSVEEEKKKREKEKKRRKEKKKKKERRKTKERKENQQFSN